MKNILENAFPTLAGCLFGWLLVTLFEHKSPTDNKLAHALYDTLRTTRDSLGRETATKLALVSNVNTLNVLLQNKDGLLKDKDTQIRLLMKATKKTDDATYVKSKTTDNISVAPVSVDTTTHIYKYKGEDKWFKYDATASPEVLDLNYGITNEYVLRHDKTKVGVETTIKNMNPHTTTEEVISYKVQYPKPKKWSIGPAMGYGISTDLKSHWFVGITLQRSIIRF